MRTSCTNPDAVMREQTSFSYRVVEVWNSLPDCVSFESLSAFERTISVVVFSGFLKCV